MGFCTTLEGQVATTIDVPTWAATYPDLKVDGDRMFENVLVVDNFIAPVPSAIAAHSPDLAEKPNGDPIAWVQQTGTLNVSAGVVTPSVIDNTKKHATVDPGISDVALEATLTASSNTGFEGIDLRFVDSDEGFIIALRAENTLNGVYLWKRIPNDNQTLLASFADATILNGTERRLKVIAKGSSIKVYMADVLIISVTDATYLTSTKHGLCLCRGTARDFQLAPAP